MSEEYVHSFVFLQLCVLDGRLKLQNQWDNWKYKRTLCKTRIFNFMGAWSGQELWEHGIFRFRFLQSMTCASKAKLKHCREGRLMRLPPHWLDVTKCLPDTNRNTIQTLENEALWLKGSLLWQLCKVADSHDAAMLDMYGDVYGWGLFLLYCRLGAPVSPVVKKLILCWIWFNWSWFLFYSGRHTALVHRAWLAIVLF